FYPFYDTEHSALGYLRSVPTRRSSDLSGVCGEGRRLQPLSSRLRRDGRRWQRLQAAPGREDHRLPSLEPGLEPLEQRRRPRRGRDRKSTRLNSSHVKISYAVVCLKKKR